MMTTTAKACAAVAKAEEMVGEETGGSGPAAVIFPKNPIGKKTRKRKSPALAVPGRTDQGLKGGARRTS